MEIDRFDKFGEPLPGHYIIVRAAIFSLVVKLLFEEPEKLYLELAKAADKENEKRNHETRRQYANK